MSWICYKSLIVAAPGFGLLALLAVCTLPGSASWLFKPKGGWEVAGSGGNWSGLLLHKQDRSTRHF